MADASSEGRSARAVTAAARRRPAADPTGTSSGSVRTAFARAPARARAPGSRRARPHRASIAACRGPPGSSSPGGAPPGWARRRRRLEWHGSTLLRQVAGVVGARRRAGRRGAGARPGAARPAGRHPRRRGRPRGARTARRACAPGCEALDPAVEAAYVASVDLPFLPPEARAPGPGRARRGASTRPCRAPGARAHPLAAAYRTAVRPPVAALLDGAARGWATCSSASTSRGSTRSREAPREPQRRRRTTPARGRCRRPR